FQTDIAKRYARIARFIEDFKIKQWHSAVATSTKTSQPDPTSQPRLKTVQLPRLELKEFNGDPLRWSEFNDGFKATIDSNPQISEIQKFTYLRSLVTDEAKRLIDGYQTTEANYKSAYALLEKRYGDTQLIVQAHMESLWSHPVPSYNATSLKDFHDSLETTVRSLRALGKPESG
ncbi:uncharacterized protein LOC144359010, partial [Saccoglossus kowalevskii]